MPHKCARCGRIYDDRAPELMNGCSCGARVFLYLREKPGRTREKTIEKLKSSEISEKDIEILNEKFANELKNLNKTISLDIENLLRVSEGKYILDIASLMRGDPIVIKEREGVYYIDIPYSMKKKRRLEK
ncbi:MAG: hypothetical protein DRO94_04725 [Candidatus Altiarchaeales archaeon]|nr:MAG: hypothetical protein DRO95_06195 [Candidatus Altiarchaeales archaeon]RLI93640.1 MAG: hypothetical protein DRO94_04725 [Candidatus Altiarchaeales archaeon]HDO81861.1 hypothetical protein [Candidatus Altiarchaeales archaeon]HEX54510.1 hypothetical protein [Candidatus Altiarchaeales archaeon]